VDRHHVKYVAKDTRNKKLIVKGYMNEQLIDIVIQHIPAQGHQCHAIFWLNLTPLQGK